MKKVLLVLTTLMATSAWADDIRLGTPAYGGNGCPGGSASAVLSPDRKSLSILFDRFMTETGGTSRRRLDRKSCNVAVPVHVPTGYSISLFQLDYRGYNNLPAGASSNLNVEYFFAGQRGPRVSRTFAGYQTQDYLVSDRVAATGVVWSPCGADVNLRINASMTTQTNSRLEEAMSTVDSTDIKAGLLYSIQWKRCN